MKEIVLQAFNKALKNYLNKANRHYTTGLFTDWRHSFSKTDKINKLEHALLNCTNETALSVIINHFLSADATFNHHSFNTYLIDELKKSITQVAWDCFTPLAIKKYNGPVYRGTSQPPEKIFNTGFKELASSNWIEDYLKFKNDSIGISTTNDFDCALEYATNNKRSGNQRYIYVINYRDNDGYDILETGKARGLSFNPFLHKDRYSGWDKREINIKGSISNDDIVGAWKISEDGNLSWIDNANYRAEKIISLTMPTAD